ncbi:hypothetical protein I7I50_11987 [Histoplasma capsulatum G186AR]|uniref:Uncharacterized protein n=1 Tax=Ajellomyces capsulatus TaxID=5037 RepID=A0A8H7Y8I6_AJECA|nr:hypothetical protein I7I52_11683 [Histoplasma capsulatum]QSS70377.1 hypothetical protein I7I50_11987 [Histoplasma capsulatum G186AR]
MVVLRVLEERKYLITDVNRFEVSGVSGGGGIAGVEDSATAFVGLLPSTGLPVSRSEPIPAMVS